MSTTTTTSSIGPPNPTNPFTSPFSSEPHIPFDPITDTSLDSDSDEDYLDDPEYNEEEVHFSFVTDLFRRVNDDDVDDDGFDSGLEDGIDVGSDREMDLGSGLGEEEEEGGDWGFEGGIWGHDGLRVEELGSDSEDEFDVNGNEGMVGVDDGLDRPCVRWDDLGDDEWGDEGDGDDDEGDDLFGDGHNNGDVVYDRARGGGCHDLDRARVCWEEDDYDDNVDENDDEFDDGVDSDDLDEDGEFDDGMNSDGALYDWERTADDREHSHVHWDDDNGDGFGDGGINDDAVYDWERAVDEFSEDETGIDFGDMVDVRGESVEWYERGSRVSFDVERGLGAGGFEDLEWESVLVEAGQDLSEVMGNPPAARSVIENLPAVHLVDEGLCGEDTLCAICKDEFSVEEKVRRLPCSHYYHGECITPWLKIRNTCPVCRYELPTDDRDYEFGKREWFGEDEDGMAPDLEVRYDLHMFFWWIVTRFSNQFIFAVPL
ncbi:E3 ubiquitin-protein ligase RING1-like protein [Drosera capensis]